MERLAQRYFHTLGCIAAESNELLLIRQPTSLKVRGHPLTLDVCVEYINYK